MGGANKAPHFELRLRDRLGVRLRKVPGMFITRDFCRVRHFALADGMCKARPGLSTASPMLAASVRIAGGLGRYWDARQELNL